MKKIIAAFVLFFAVSFTTNAQEKKATDPLVLAKNELNDLIKVIPLDSSLENGLYNLLVYKHESLAKAISNEEKAKVYDTMKSKLNSTFTPEQMTILKNNKKLYDDLIR